MHSSHLGLRSLLCPKRALQNPSLMLQLCLQAAHGCLGASLQGHKRALGVRHDAKQ